MSIRAEISKNLLLKDLANIALEYDEPCDRIADIKKHCTLGQYIHANPTNDKQGLNCRNYCTRGRKIEKFWTLLPTMIEGSRFGLCIDNLEPIDFYGVDTKGNVFPDIPNINTLTGIDFLEWTIVYDLSNITDCDVGLTDVREMLDEYFGLGSSSSTEMEISVTDSRGVDWVLDRVTISRPENYILVVQSRSEMRD